jgi:hypothetical protein
MGQTDQKASKARKYFWFDCSKIAPVQQDNMRMFQYDKRIGAKNMTKIFRLIGSCRDKGEETQSFYTAKELV